MRGPMPLTYTTEARELPSLDEADHVVVRATGELDVVTSGRLRRSVTDAIRLAPARVVIDLGEVTFMDSSGLGALLAMRTLASGAGVAFSVTGPTRQVRRVLEMTGTYERLVDC